MTWHQDYLAAAKDLLAGLTCNFSGSMGLKPLVQEEYLRKMLDARLSSRDPAWQKFLVVHVWKPLAVTRLSFSQHVPCSAESQIEGSPARLQYVDAIKAREEEVARALMPIRERLEQFIDLFPAGTSPPEMQAEQSAASDLHPIIPLNPNELAIYRCLEGTLKTADEIALSTKIDIATVKKALGRAPLNEHLSNRLGQGGGYHWKGFTGL